MPGNANVEQAISEGHITNYPEKAAYNQKRKKTFIQNKMQVQ